ncbi:hypothetical protein GQ53DRAFT_847211 [Thozetella sp. PMI_491]|nr:hypothetical protein GQ53DRAFT_847211 [Thozetella sp. PMI_491]
MAKAAPITLPRSLSQEASLFNRSDSRSIHGSPPAQYPDPYAEGFRACPIAACLWPSSQSLPLSRPGRHNPWETSGTCQCQQLVSMFVTTLLIKHAGTIGGAAEGRDDRAVETGPRRGSRKRNSSLNEPDEDEDWDPEEEGDRSRALKRGKVEGASTGQQATFACPFFKMNPIRHHSCLFYKMSKISYVKQHLKRTHKAPKWRCTVCQDVFPDQPSYNRHQNTRECKSSTSRGRQDEMDEGQWGEIDRLTSRRPGATAESMWYAMFGVLFPGTPLPATPYVESGISEMTKHFRDFVKERGAAILKSHLEVSGAWQTMAERAADPDVFLQFVMTYGIDIVFESWGQSMDSAGLHVSPAPNTAVFPRNSIYEESVAEGVLFIWDMSRAPTATVLSVQA